MLLLEIFNETNYLDVVLLIDKKKLKLLIARLPKPKKKKRKPFKEKKI